QGVALLVGCLHDRRRVLHVRTGEADAQRVVPAEGYELLVELLLARGADLEDAAAALAIVEAGQDVRAVLPDVGVGHARGAPEGAPQDRDVVRGQAAEQIISAVHARGVSRADSSLRPA